MANNMSNFEAKTKRIAQSLDVDEGDFAAEIKDRRVSALLNNQVASEILASRRVTGLNTGFRRLDETIGGLRSRTCTILAGATGMGKSLLGLNILVNLAKDGYKVCYFDLENGPYESFERILRVWYALPKDWFEDSAHKADIEHMRRGLTNIEYYSHEDLYDLGLGKRNLGLILELIQKGAGNGVRVFLVDPLQAFEAGARDAHALFSQQGLIVRRLKEVAQTLDLVVIVCHHLRKSQRSGDWVGDIEEIEDIKYRIPTLEDVKGSSKIADFATGVWGMVRMVGALEYQDRGKTIVRVLKNRSGRLGDVRLFFEEETLIFQEV